MRNFENTLKHIIWKQFEIYERFLKTLWNTFWKHTIWKPLKPMGEYWKHFETHNLKTIETYDKFGKHFETHNLKTLWNTFWKNTIWRPLKPMGNFENTLKHIIWKPLKPMKTFENTLKHIIWKHFETHNLKTIETYGRFLKTLWNTLFENTLKQFENHWNIWEIFENTLKTILIPHWAITTQVWPLKP